MPEVPRTTVENPRAFKRPNEVWLSPQDTSANIILNRLRRADSPVIIRGDWGGRPGIEVSMEFGKIVDACQGDIWLKHAVLFIDQEKRRVTFHNGCILYFKE